MHQTDNAAFHAAADRKKITCIIQKMQLHIWETYIQVAEEDVKRADEFNAIQSIEQSLYEPEQDYDYDPFAQSTETSAGHDEPHSDVHDT